MGRQTVLVLAGLVAFNSTMALAQDRAQGQRRWRAAGDVSQAVVLTAEQKQKVAKLEEELGTKMREQMSNLPRDEAARETWRQRRQELLDAAKAGDEAKVEALQKKQQETGWTALRRKLAAEYYDAVAKLLTDKQKEPFATWRKLQDSGLPSNLLADPDGLKAALKAAKLSDAQQKEIDAAYERYGAQAKGLAADDVAGKQEATHKLAAAVVAQLKPSQTVLIADAERQNRRRARGQ